MMTKDEAIYQYILKHFAETGRAPSARAIQQHFALDQKPVRDALQRLEDKHAFYRDPRSKRIIAAYPFSAKPTAHVVHLPNSRALFALCAIAALAMPLMLKTNAVITSACVRCGRAITVEVRKGRVHCYVPKTIRVWDMKRDLERVTAVVCCPNMNFFCSPRHLAEWQAEHPDIQ